MKENAFVAYQKVDLVSSGFKLVICRLLDFGLLQIMLNTFLWNLRIKTSLRLEFFYSGKPRSFWVSVYTSSSRICAYVTPKSVKLYTILLHLVSILAPNLQWGSLKCSPILRSYWNYSLNFCNHFWKDNPNPKAMICFATDFMQKFLSYYFKFSVQHAGCRNFINNYASPLMSC